MDDIISDFLTESAENLEVIDSELVRFEANPSDGAILAKVFRLVHTIKGTCGFLGLRRLEAVAHAAETVLGLFRDGKLDVSPDSVSLILRSIDRIKMLLADLAASGEEPPGSDQDLIEALERVALGAGPGAEEPVQALAEPADEPPTPEQRTVRPGEATLEELDAAFAAAPGPEFGGLSESPVVVAAAGASSETETSGEPAPDAVLQTIRVNVDVLDDMVTLVSELVLIRNQLLQINRRREDSAFVSPLQRLSAITGELQESVMQTRMQPIGAAWKKLPRMVRDLARDLGKKIDLVLLGETTELDRQVLELIRDPLTHMVRNSGDHGLETPSERRAAGKPERGAIRVSASHEGQSIVITIADDGRGLDTARIRAKAVEAGLMSRSDADALSVAQVHRLIFNPGFSTAETVTSVSGRGVGMDVVWSNIQQIGGQIEIQSTAGAGTTFTIKIPLTLAIIPSLQVQAGGQLFSLPQGSVLELVKVGGGSGHRIETIERVRLLRLRDDLIPVMDLAEALGLRARADEAAFVVIMNVGQRRLGLVVDQVIDTEEIVVKPLASILRSIGQFSGATILGDGSVVLILDPNALAERIGEAASALARPENEAREFEELAAGETKAMLLFQAGPGAPKAVELSSVTRLERVPTDSLEHSKGRTMLQYRGRLMPVLLVDSGQELRRDGHQPMLVFSGAIYSMGLAVDEITDVVESQFELEFGADRDGVLGTAVIGGKATEVIDVDHFLVLGLAERNRAMTPSDESLAA